MTYRAFADYERRPATDFIRFFDDFLTYTAGDWTITTTEAGAGAATEALATDEVGGVLVVTNDDADNDVDAFQLLPAAGHFSFVTGRKMAFKIRAKLSDATESDFIAGLYPTDTSPIAGLDDGIFFKSDDGDALLDVYVTKNGVVTSQTAVATLLDATYHDLEAYYDGVSTVHFYVDGTRVAGLAVTNAPDDTQLRPSFAFQNGEAAAKVLSVDFIEAIQERVAA